MGKEDGLTKKEKMAFVRSIIIRMPNYREYGFNRAVIRAFKKEHGITIEDYDISKYISQIEAEWKEQDTQRITKSQLKEMLLNVYKNNKDIPHAQIRSLHEIGKLDNHYNPDIIINNILPENEERLKKIFGNRKDTVKKGKGEKQNE